MQSYRYPGRLGVYHDARPDLRRIPYFLEETGVFFHSRDTESRILRTDPNDKVIERDLCFTYVAFDVAVVYC
jgi:hypothetical protein